MQGCNFSQDFEGTVLRLAKFSSYIWVKLSLHSSWPTPNFLLSFCLLEWSWTFSVISSVTSCFSLILQSINLTVRGKLWNLVAFTILQSLKNVFVPLWLSLVTTTPRFSHFAYLLYIPILFRYTSLFLIRHHFLWTYMKHQKTDFLRCKCPSLKSLGIILILHLIRSEHELQRTMNEDLHEFNFTMWLLNVLHCNKFSGRMQRIDVTVIMDQVSTKWCRQVINLICKIKITDI